MELFCAQNDVMHQTDADIEKEHVLFTNPFIFPDNTRLKNLRNLGSEV